MNDRGIGSSGIMAVFAMIERAAESGEPCPSNDAIVEALGYASPSSATAAIRSMERVKLIRVEYRARQRIVEIVATGKRTAVPVRRAPKIVRKRVMPSIPRGSATMGEVERGFRGAVPLAQTVDRDPCWRCQARADAGCSHRPPSGTAPVVHADDGGGRWAGRETAYGFMTRIRR